MKYQIPGTLFYLYLILAGVERFLVEMIRVNPKVVLGLSQAQLIALFMVAAGTFLFMRNKAKEDKAEKTPLSVTE